MSKIGQKPVIIPASVQTELRDNSILVKGKLGEGLIKLPNNLTIEKTTDSILIKRKKDDKVSKSLHGLFRNLIDNLVKGVEQPWTKRLEVVGTGFNVKMQGEDLVFKVGFSHQVVFKKYEGVKFAVEGNNIVIVSGIDKQIVGQAAYQIKLIRKPDAYKGKGIRYEGERLRIKPGKKAKTA